MYPKQLAAQFGCGKTQILNTLAQRERYTREWEVSGRNNPSIGARKRFRHTRNEQINRSVHEWYKEQAENGIRVTGKRITFSKYIFRIIRLLFMKVRCYKDRLDFTPVISG